MTREGVAKDDVPPPRAQRSTGPGRRRRVGLLFVALVGVPLGLVLMAATVVVAMALSGMSIDASRWREAIAQRASDALGRPVMLQGPLEIEPTLGRELAVRVGPLRILNRPGFAEQEFLAIGELRARIDLFEALRGRLRSSRIEASDVDLRLERGADGTGNWSALPQRDAGARPPAIDIARFVLHRLDVHYLDARSATRRSVELDELSGSAGWDRPLRLAARGRLEPHLVYALAIEGGPMRLLQDDAGSWPFNVEASTNGARLRADGALDPRQGTARLQVTARAEDMAPIERLIGSPLPDFGDASVQCMVTIAADSVHIGDLYGRLGKSAFSGQLIVGFGGARPRVTGALSAAALDLRPFLLAPPQAESQGSGTGARAEQPLPLRDLAAVDAEVDLKVEVWLGLGVDVRDTSVAWRSDERGVRVPMSATIAGVPFAGGLELDTSAPTPALAFRLGADNAALGELARGLGDASAVEGKVGRVRLRMEGRGDTTASLARDLEFSLALSDGQLRFGGAAGADPVVVSIDALNLAARRDERLRGQALGAVQGQRAKASFRGGTLPGIWRERVLPLELDLALAGARLRVDGTLALAGSTRDAALRFDLQAGRVGDLARWLGVAPQASLPLALRGQVRLSDEAWRLHGTTLELGRSQLTIDARSAPVAGRPGIVASVRSTLIDAQELSTLHAGSVDGGAAPRRTARASPTAIDWPDADVDFRLQRVRLRRTDLEDLAFFARTRGGRLSPLAITGKIADAPFTADVEMDLHARPPVASLALSTGTIDVGALLRGLGVAEDIDGSVQALQVNVMGRGSSLGEWVAHSGFDVRVSGGHLAVRGAAQSTLAEVRVDGARIGARAGEPVRAWVEGEIDQTPVSIELESGTLADFASDAGRMPFALAARAAGTQMTLDGGVTLPLGSGGQLSFAMSGKRLDSLSGLTRVELPAWGPWSVAGPIRMTPTGYELPGLNVSVGRSRLEGSGRLDLSGPRPYLDLQVTAPSIQLDDFPLPERLTEPPEPSDEGRGLLGVASRAAGRTDKLLSAAFLRRLDATVDVKAKEVLSGDDRLADGALRLQLERGRLSLDPVVVNLPGGALRLSLSYDLKESEVAFAGAAYIERFDYGIIARRLSRANDVRGLFSLNLELAGTAPSLDTLMRNASGKLDFAVWPTELRSGVFNLWSVNLLLKLVPLIDREGKPEVNCVVGRFDLKHGILSDDKILIDTTRVRMRGAGRANLATEEVEFVFRPRAKGFALFRLQTPLRVTGTLDDQRFGFEQRDVAESVLRLIASPILLPIERFTLGPLPRDGADVCTDPLRAMAR